MSSLFPPTLDPRTTRLNSGSPEFPRMKEALSRRGSIIQLPSHCIQTLNERNHSVMSLIASETHLFTGSQGGCIHVWDLETFQPTTKLLGHTGSIFSLALSADGNLLFSASGDGTARVWCTGNFQCIYSIRTGSNAGDVLSIAYSDSKGLLFLGCQNTSIQWFDLNAAIGKADCFTSSGDTDGGDAHPSDPFTHPISPSVAKFFGVGGPKTDSDEESLSSSSSVSTTSAAANAKLPKYSVRANHCHSHAHHGYIHALEVGKLIGSDKSPDEECLFSGAGDGMINIWKITPEGLILHKSLEAADGNIYTLALRENILIAGIQGGDIKIWDLESLHAIRTLIAHEDDILSIAADESSFYSASADGVVKRWNYHFDCVQEMIGHKGIVLSLTLGQSMLISGANDNLVKFWSIPPIDDPSDMMSGSGAFSPNSSALKEGHTNKLLSALEYWIGIRSVSGNASRYQEDCRASANYLKSILRQLGAEAKLVYPEDPTRNPLVFGRFKAKAEGKGDATEGGRRRNVLFYGHYDIVGVDASKWKLPAFKMTGEDGFVYGRGVSDNKGPILAAIFAVHDLLKERTLDMDVHFLIEGEEENGSVGFADTVKAHQEYFGQPDVILLSNSYWLNDTIPCLTYGLRGNIKATIEISTKGADRHSGVDGGQSSEPLIYLIKLLSKLVGDDGTVLVPGFSEDVRAIGEGETSLYTDLTTRILESRRVEKRGDQGVTPKELADELMRRWRFPTLTVHAVDVSAPKGTATLIPRSATAKVSMRTVPDQVAATIVSNFEAFIHSSFAQLTKTDCQIKVHAERVADWWLGNPEDEYFKILERAIEEEWGQKPLYIREGGSIPAVKWLERLFGVSAVNFPMGQASDSAHLNDERIRLKNLFAGRKIFKSFFKSLSA